MSGSTHETLRREDDDKPGSDRGFGLVMAVVFLLLAAIQAWSGAWGWAALWLGVAAGFFALASTKPHLLHPANRLWFRFGLLLHRVVNPVVMGLMFFCVFTPIGVLMRLFGQRPLALDLDRSAPSYWIERRATPAAPGSMRKQF